MPGGGAKCRLRFSGDHSPQPTPHGWPLAQRASPAPFPSPHQPLEPPGPPGHLAQPAQCRVLFQRPQHSPRPSLPPRTDTGVKTRSQSLGTGLRVRAGWARRPPEARVGRPAAGRALTQLRPGHRVEAPPPPLWVKGREPVWRWPQMCAALCAQPKKGLWPPPPQIGALLPPKPLPQRLKHPRYPPSCHLPLWPP